MASFETLSFYRGVSNETPLDRPSLIHTRKNRRPRDTPICLHEAADKWFKASFGVAYRSQAVFLTPNRMTAQFYGKSPNHCVRVVPLGEYSYCWSSKYSDFLHLAKDAPTADELTARLPDAGYGTTDLALAHQSGNELMLCCDVYMAVPIGLLFEEIELVSRLSVILGADESFN
ncbi:MAG: hypothetical protein Q7K57_17140 [Burkholderiaceae bacterium]|nr:hypothetical protein [Burkholderiaceae bacterium]